MVGKRKKKAKKLPEVEFRLGVTSFVYLVHRAIVIGLRADPGFLDKLRAVNDMYQVQHMAEHAKKKKKTKK